MVSNGRRQVLNGYGGNGLSTPHLHRLAIESKLKCAALDACSARLLRQHLPDNLLNFITGCSRLATLALDLSYG